jgi:hypothetical protein
MPWNRDKKGKNKKKRGNGYGAFKYKAEKKPRDQEGTQKQENIPTLSKRLAIQVWHNLRPQRKLISKYQCPLPHPE